MLLQSTINDFYNEKFETKEESVRRLTHFSYSGINLVKKIHPGESVIDVGCGYNIFKEYIPDLIGIDPVYDEADYKVALQDFNTDKKFNVAFCLGSIQFGDINVIETQIAHLVNLLTERARIYWRVNPEVTNNPQLNKFKWTLETSTAIAKNFGFTVVEHALEHTYNNTGVRLYIEWVR